MWRFSQSKSTFYFQMHNMSIEYFANMCPSYQEKSISVLSRGCGIWKAKTTLSAVSPSFEASSLLKLSILLHAFGPLGANQPSVPSFRFCGNWRLKYQVFKTISFGSSTKQGSKYKFGFRRKWCSHFFVFYLRCCHLPLEEKDKRVSKSF